MENRDKSKSKYDGRGDQIEMQMFVANRIEREIWTDKNYVIDEIGKEAKNRVIKARGTEPDEEATKLKIDNILEQLRGDIDVLRDDSNRFEFAAFEEISTATKQHYDSIKAIDVRKNEELRQKKIEAYQLITNVNRLITAREARSKFVKIY